MAVTGTIVKDGNEQTIEYPVSNGEVNCSGDDLIKLAFSENDAVLVLDCSLNQLTELNIPTECEVVNCNNNKLTKLVVPANCKTVYCNDNDISLVNKPDDCVIFCGGNRIAKIV